MARSMKVYIVRDYHMDPEVAKETGEDPVDTILAPELDYDEFPYRVLDLLECNYFYGSHQPEEDELPEVGGKVLYGTVEFTEEGEVLSFEPDVEVAG